LVKLVIFQWGFRVIFLILGKTDGGVEAPNYKWRFLRFKAIYPPASGGLIS